MAKLEVIAGPQTGLTFSITPDRPEYLIGRNPNNPIVLVDMNASRNHARVTCKAGVFYAEDLKSSNGTYVNGLQLKTPVRLKQGDEIKIGATIFRFSEKEPVFTAPGKPLPGVPDDLDFGQSFVQMLDEKEDQNLDLVLSEDEAVDAKDTSEAYQNVLNKLKTLYKVSEDIGTILNLSTVLEKIMDAIFEVFTQIDRGFIMLEDPVKGEMVPEVIRKRGAKEGEQIKVSVSRTIIETAFREKKSILSSDAMEDDRFAEGLSIVNFGIRSMMCSPLFVGEEKLGVIHVDTQDSRKPFTAEDLSLLQGIGRQAAISIKNAKLVVSIEEETKRRNSLQRFLSPDLADQVMSGAIDLKLGGDEKFGTVFFSDIIGFTRMSSVLPPEVVVAKINRYFNIMIDIIFKHNGTINKFWGDAIMALWGLMSAKDDHAPQAMSVEACIDMQNALFDFNYALIEEGQKPIQMGIGLNTGRFLAGNVGSEQQMEYTVIGDNVNLAARIESKAARGQIYISESTYERVKAYVYAIKMNPTYVKGKEEPIQIYSMRGFRDSDHRDKPFDRLTIPSGYVDTTGKRHNGLLNGIFTVDGKVHLYAHFKECFAEGTVLEVSPDLFEISAPGTLQCKVREFTIVNPEGEVRFYRYTLELLKSSDCFDALRNHELLIGDVDVDSIKRE